MTAQELVEQLSDDLLKEVWQIIGQFPNCVKPEFRSAVYSEYLDRLMTYIDNNSIIGDAVIGDDLHLL